MKKLMMLAAMLAMAVMMAAPATAIAHDFDGDGFEEFCDDFDSGDFCEDDEDEFEFDESVFLVPLFFEVEIDDIDCNGLDDDFDGFTDEDVVCVVEFDFD